MVDESKSGGVAPGRDRVGDAQQELAVLREELAARDKTIQVLIARVEGQLARRPSALAVLEQNISLEQKAMQRTRQLEQSHEDLSRTLHELKLAQSQLLEANKLEAIGLLAAGVAHELNTPVQFVADNAGFLQEAFEKVTAALDDTRGVVGSFAAAHPDAVPLRELDGRLRAQGLTWLCAQIPRAIEQSLEGLERVTTIVSAMKEFSHPSAGQKQLTDLHEAIKTTLTVARHEWKYVADVETEFDVNVPHVPCMRNELNQVFLNLIVNAAHAIAERTSGGPPEKGLIVVSTERIGGEVEIRIRDNGAGIPEPIRSRVYDPFFTTKPVGKGTGQGLAIARSVVVNKHGGTMRFESEAGVGTCFYLRLPVLVSSSGLGPTPGVT